MLVFNATRLRVARERSGLLRKDVAAPCGVTPQTISNWESGLTVPSDDLTARLASVTGFPRTFFFAGDIEILPEGSVSFRARTKILARHKHTALAAGAMAKELAAWIESRFELPPVRLPDLSSQEPDLVARVIRAEWMLGEKPIPNMIHLLESRGILVLSLAQDVRALDAFSFWSGNRPIVLLNTMKSAERSRVDAAHELFHLLSHKEETGKTEEEDADRFAGMFLMPKDDVYRHVPRILGLPQLIDVKKRWGVSVAALVYRLHELGIASDWQYRTLFIELSKRGYRTEEPEPLPEREGSALLAQVFGFPGKGRVRLSTVARELSWQRIHLDEFLFGLGAALVPLEGGRTPTARPTRPDLRLVDTDGPKEDE